MTVQNEHLAMLEVPGPTITGLTAPFWAAAEEGKLVIQRCGSCNKAVFYPRNLCPYCWSEDLSWIEASGSGVLKSFSLVHKPGHPGWVPAAPYHVILVELSEGPTMLSHLISEDQKISIGDPVQFCAVKIGERALPCFRVAT